MRRPDGSVLRSLACRAGESRDAASSIRQSENLPASSCGTRSAKSPLNQHTTKWTKRHPDTCCNSTVPPAGVAAVQHPPLPVGAFGGRCSLPACFQGRPQQWAIHQAASYRFLELSSQTIIDSRGPTPSHPELKTANFPSLTSKPHQALGSPIGANMLNKCL